MTYREEFNNIIEFGYREQAEKFAEAGGRFIGRVADGVKRSDILGGRSQHVAAKFRDRSERLRAKAGGIRRSMGQTEEEFAKSGRSLKEHIEGGDRLKYTEGRADQMASKADQFRERGIRRRNNTLGIGGAVIAGNYLLNKRHDQ